MQQYQRDWQEQIDRMDTKRLVAEYIDIGRSVYPHNPLYHNAREYADMLGSELLKRGITEIPNIFGPIRVRNDYQQMPKPTYGRRTESF